MFMFRNGYAAVLLLCSMQSFVSASSEDEKNSARIVSLMQSPWIDGMNSVSHDFASLCAKDVTAVMEAVESGHTWALEMLDASSKIQPGIMKGNFRDLGMYDECVAVKGQYNGTHIQGKHCTISYGHLSSSVCVPASCDEKDVTEILDAAIQNVTKISELKLGMNGVSCVPVGSADWTVEEIVTIFFFSVIGAFILFCSICEFVEKWRPAGVAPTISQLAKFSLYANAKSILSTKPSHGMMPAIQGIRFLSMCWVILGHRYMITLVRPMVNSLVKLEWNNSWSAVYIQAAPFAVDTFFVISGFLMSFLFLKAKQSGKRSNFLMMYINRYLRLTPCLAALVLFVAVLLHRVANGPLWNTLLAVQVEPCRKKWWVTLLYVQNFVMRKDPCLLHCWYLSVDMQLFWISPIILYPLYRWPKLGLKILYSFLVLSVVTPAVVLAVNGYSNALFHLNKQVEITNSVDILYYYIPTYNRAGAYFIGILLGYDAANRKRHFTPTKVAINWILACILMLLCGLATNRIYDTRSDYNIVLETVLAVLLRPFWSISIAWIVYACTHGYGGPVTRFLSLPIFLPLSRLSYTIYLVHLVIQVITISAAQIPGRFSVIPLLNDFWGDLVLSIAVAFIFALFFESPVIVLQKMVIKRGRQRSSTREPKKDVVGGIDNAGMTEIHSNL